MITEIKSIELASNLSRKRLEKFQSDAENGFIEELPLPNGIYKDNKADVLIFTDEAQKMYDKFFDYFLNEINSCTTTKKDTIDFTKLKNECRFSYNDIVKRFNELEHRIEFSSLFKSRFLENFLNVLVLTSDEFNIALNSITIDMFNKLEHGEEVELTPNYVLYKYSEEDIYSVFIKDEWIEMVQVLINGDKFIFEEL